MNVTKVTAFKDNDGMLWESDEEAIDSNIESCLSQININSGDSYSEAHAKIKNWIVNNKSSLRYVIKHLK